jgi:NAD(P)-dependent dehydrogenase (short-subunit alcohol dehydrogenase family)
VASEIRAEGGEASAFRADVADARDLGDLTLEQWNRVLAVNLTAPFLATKFALARMIEQGGGVIVNMSSAVAMSAEHGLGAYAAAKAGVVSLTRSTAIEYARHHIRANCILPGAIATPPTMMFIATVEGARDRIESATPFRRLGRPEEVANLVLFLASDEASYINGAAYFIDGGAAATHNIGLMGRN